VASLVLGKMNVEVEGDAREQRAVLTGRLDEEARLDQLLVALSAPRLVLDAAGVDFINSIGIREWIHLLIELRRRAASVALVRASEPLTAQLSMLRAARDSVDVRSVYVPYECTACLREENALIDIATHRASLAAMRAPVLPCPECGGRMELADLPERYFLFVRDAQSAG
jgi:anti-anti-sigma regulatory factor